MMEQIFTSTSRIGDIVTQFPKSEELFKEYKIDFCCGGHRPLTEAVSDTSAKVEEVVSRLNELYLENKELAKLSRDWQIEGYSVLIDHIIANHHSYLRQELPILSELTTKILKVHGVGHEYLARVHKLFHLLKMDLEQHLIKEEEVLFPLVKEYEQEPSAEKLQEILKVNKSLEEEHVGAGDILKELREITKDYTLPEDACRTYAAAYQKLEELEADLFKHIHLENNILFRRLSEEK